MRKRSIAMTRIEIPANGTATEHCGEINGLGKHVYALRISIIRTYLHIVTRYERTLAYSQR